MNNPNDKDMNRDPITNEPGAHPVGTGVGAGSGALAGAAVGAAGGPVGAAVGAVVGAVAGGLAGKGVAEAINPTAEEAYWSSTYDKEGYYRTGYTYDDYGPAYRAGWESRISGVDDWEQNRSEWERRWSEAKGTSRLTPDEAEPAARAAWERTKRDTTQG